jgi:hypothetical protein
MAMTGKAKIAIDKFCTELGLDVDDPADDKVQSLGKALKLAMQTIRNATPAVSGPATALKKREEDAQAQLVKCPIELPSGLAEFSHCSYKGWYHTDTTLPRLYFQPDIKRPELAALHELDFTYIFDERISNADYVTTGAGVQIRDPSEMIHGENAGSIAEFSREGRYVGEELSADDATHMRADIFAG